VNDLNELVEGVLGRADDGEAMEVFASAGTEVEIKVYDGRVENLARAASGGVGIRILREGAAGARIGVAWTGSLDENAIDRAVSEARDNVRFASEDEFLAFARPDGVAAASLELTDPSVRSMSLDDKVALVVETERLVRGAERIRQVESADYSDYDVQTVVASTYGVHARTDRTGSFLSVEAIAADGSGDQTGWGLQAGRGPAALEAQRVATDAISRATRLLGAVKPTSVRTTAVFSPRSTATLLAIIGSALSGDAVVRGRSIFAGRFDTEVASRVVSVIDDPTDPRQFAASRYDGEGLACRRNVLIDHGRLAGFVYDTVAARRAGVSSTGSAVRGGLAGPPSAGCRALRFVAGPQSADEIVQLVGDGVYVDSLSGVHSGVNPISGDFSVGFTGFMIRGGHLAEPLREATVASTLQRMLLDVIAVGSDVEWLPGNAAGQTIAVTGVSVGGR